MIFSDEQKLAIKLAEEGKNLYIDAVIGAGKTTVLNEIANRLNRKEILYLTYNRLLKEDAKKKIRLRNVEIHNYHGFVYKYLSYNRKPYSNMNGIKDFVNYVEEEEIRMPQYDVILVDEYQDIDFDSSNLIKSIYHNQKTKPQIIFVGDMKQKIYDKTTIDVLEDTVFQISKDFIKIDFTNCFRINEPHSDMLSKIWKKKIKGVNKDQKISTQLFNHLQLQGKLNEYENGDILILSPFRNNVQLSQFINYLERNQPEKYNKENLYVSIAERDENNKPTDNSMIVTTFDGAKGLERKLCIVFGWDENTLQFRSKNGSKEIIRNLFLVAASRGKDEIIFIKDRNTLLDEYNFERNLLSREIDDNFKVSEMFDFKYDTDIRKAYEFLEIKEIEQDDDKEIIVTSTDYNINLAPSIGIYQEAVFFKSWDYQIALTNYDKEKPVVKYVKKVPAKTIEKQVLCITACETDLTRYATQAIESFIDPENKDILIKRLETHLSKDDETQINVSTDFLGTNFSGRIDAIKNGIPYELKFTNELELKHFLQIAMYVYMGNFEKGIVWNTRFNKMYEVSIKNKEAFIKQVYKTVRKI